MNQQNHAAGPVRRVATAREARTMIGDGDRKFRDRRKNDPTFPLPIRLSGKQPVWRIDDINTWLAAQPTIEARPEPIALRRARQARDEAAEPGREAEPA